MLSNYNWYMVLILDVGNTRVKSAVFEGDSCLSMDFFLYDLLILEIEKKIMGLPLLEAILFSSVSKITKSDLEFIPKPIKIVDFSSIVDFPFKNKYATPHTLGIDRKILASGAVIQFPAMNRLVIDAGTCITFDFVNENDEYLGGAISLGIEMRYKALHHFTDKLPLLAFDPNTIPSDFIGNSTANSIHNGVVEGVLLEIEGSIQNYIDRFSNIIIILTGGDADFLAKRLKNTIFANSYFLMESMNQLYQLKFKDD